MRIPAKRKLIVGGVAILAVAGGGAALAATQLDSPSARSQAIIDDAAGQLGIDSGKLSDALKKALEDQVDAAVKAGEISKAQGDEIKSRIESSDYPIFGGRFGLGPGFGFGKAHVMFGFVDSLSTASDYLGMTQAELRSQLISGKTLADIAREKGKSVDGLVSALVDAAKKRIDQAVSDGRLTKDQASEIEADLKDRITDLVNGTKPALPGLGEHGMMGRGMPGGFGDMWGGMRIWRSEQERSSTGGTTF